MGPVCFRTRQHLTATSFGSATLAIAFRSMAFPRAMLLAIASSGMLGLAGCGPGNTATTPLKAADFSIADLPTALQLTPGGAAGQISVAINGTNGFASPVAVAVTGLPAGVTVSATPLSINPGTMQALSFTASAGAAAGSTTVTLNGTSGSLTHSATLAINVVAPPPPDFALALSPAALTLTTGATGQQVSVSVSAINSFTAPVNVAISALPPGVTATPSTLTVTPGTPQSFTLSAAASAATGSTSVTFSGASGTLQHSATLALSVLAVKGLDVTTYHFDNARSGLNSNETILTPAKVSSSAFGKLNLLTADGKVDAEPLYLSAVTINATPHNVLYVASEHDSVYAFDADTGTQLWKVSTLGTGESTSDPHGCGQISPEIGITSTPVIDRQHGDHGVIFVVAMSKDIGGVYHQRLHALDLTTGAETSGSPSEIAGSYPGAGDNSTNGVVAFDPGQYAERVGLLLLNQTIYMGWTSHCDQRPYTGWVMGYSETTLQQKQILNLTPNGSEGSIWMSGAGLAGDTSGNIYLLDANGTLDTSLDANGFPANGNFGNAILKLSTTGARLSVADYFEPYNTVAESNADLDLGSGGVLLLPDQTDATGAVHHLLVGAGKDRNIYVADRDHMGGFNPTDNSRLYQEIPNALAAGAFSAPAYFNNTVYYGGINDVLRAFSINNAKLSTAPTSTSSTSFGYPGSTPGISSNGTANGILWALVSDPGSPAVLHAYDATNLARELYNSQQAPNGRDSFGNGNKFITPLIANGRVYVGTPSGVAVFGLLP